MESLAGAIGEKFGGSVAEKNVAAASRAHDRVRDAIEARPVLSRRRIPAVAEAVALCRPE